MVLKHFAIDSKVISSGKHCRLDQKYASFTQVQDWKVFDSQFEQAKLSDFLIALPIIKYSKGELENEAYLVNISDQLPRSGELENIELASEIGSDKTLLTGSDIFVSKLGMPKGYIFVNTLKDKNLLGSSEFIPYQVKDQDSIKYLKYLLLSNKMLLAYAALESGKTPSHKRVNPYEFLKIKIPVISKASQELIVSRIEPIERKIDELKKQIKPPLDIINQVFVREFNFDIEKFKELKKSHNYYLDLSSLSSNKDLRQSVKFYRESSKFVMQELKKITASKIKFFLAEPIVLGASISPSDFDENGECYYVSMATVKNYRLDVDETQLVSDRYAKANANKYIKENDIVMTRSGVAIGKFALIENDTKGVFADFTMRIRLENYNHRFAYYYFRTDYFQHLIHTHKKGLQNQNIFPSQIRELPIIDISLEKQQKIVDEIKEELDKQEMTKYQINNERRKIEKVIEDAIA
jgi:restriction endonuclease S subunit